MNSKDISVKVLRFFGIFLMSIVAVGMLTGCFAKKTDSTNHVENGEVIFPLQEPVTLTYWGGIHSNALIIHNNHGDTEWYKELEKRTGVNIKFIHPIQGQQREQQNIMLASGDLPDMIESNFESYTGGVIKANKDGLVIDISDLQKKYAPNLTKLYETYPELLVDVQTEDEKFLRVPFIRGHDMLKTFRGPAIRRDWLQELGLEKPTTIHQWYTVLTAFKEKKGADIPLLVNSSHLKSDGFMTAYGINNGYFMENQKVVYGPADPRYKDYLTTLKKWYDEGLIYSEFPLSSNAKTFDALVSNGKVGSMIAVVGAGIGKYMALMKDVDPRFDLVGVPYPSLNEGEPPVFMHQATLSTSNSVSITSVCKQPEIAMAWLDYGYSKEGHMLLNFGIEGVSYTMENGYPTYTDVILNNPDGIAKASIGHRYCRSFDGGPFVQNNKYLEQYLDLPQQIESINEWIKYKDAVNNANTEVRGELTDSESAQVLQKQVEINTYVDEMFIKFVMSQEPLDKFDQYLARLRQMGVDDVIAIKQTAHDRFIRKFPNANKVNSVNIVDFYQ